MDFGFLKVFLLISYPSAATLQRKYFVVHASQTSSVMWNTAVWFVPISLRRATKAVYCLGEVTDIANEPLTFDEVVLCCRSRDHA